MNARITSCLLGLCLFSIPLFSHAAESAAQHDQRMAWFREARFGMFIHWGLYSVAGGEWDGKPVPSAGEWIMQNGKIPVSQYAKLVPQFNPVKFNAREWARIAKNAGMKYIVITSKHHDGFGLWNSQLTDWCVKSTPFHRDPLKELAEACKAEGIKLCFYHSIMDWHHPDYVPRRPWNDVATGEPNFDHYVDYLKGQLKELLTGYGPLGILWFDGEWENTWTHERGVDLYNYVRSLQPNIIVNNRVGKARAGMAGMDQGSQRVGDYGTPEQEIPATGFGRGVDWESCMTMNDTWGFKKNDQNWKSAQTLIRNLIDCSSKGGNYLLNVGPTGEGLIPEASVERLAAMGEWMKVNHEAIYATTASPFKRLPWGRCTTKGTRFGATLYLHIFNWPADGKLLVPGLKNKVEAAYLLVDPKRTALRREAAAEGLRISLPAAAPDPVSSTVVLTIKGQPQIEQLGIVQDFNGVLTLQASEATLHGEQIQYESGPQRDNIGFWTNPSDWAQWDFKVTRPGRFDVTAEVAALDRSSFVLSLGDQKLTAATASTGDYGKFRQVKLGRVEILATGKVMVAVRPVQDGWHPINLKAIRLKPVTGE